MFQIKDENTGLIIADIENRFGLVPRIRWTKKSNWAAKFDARDTAEKTIKWLSKLPFTFQKSGVVVIANMPQYTITEII